MSPPLWEERPMSEKKRIYRSRGDRMVAGVLGGWSAYLGLDPSLVRLVYVLLLILTGFFPGIFFYAVMAIIIPLEPKGGGERESS
jgi:phage shock protein C